jgi:hypothetical protein
METPLEKVQRLQKEATLKTQQPQSVSEFIGGTAQAAAQGLTFGFSDEIAAGISSLGSLFTDETFQESFDRTLKEKRNEIKQFKKSNPVASTVGEVVGAVAPAVASLLLAPITGGSSSVGVAASASKILNTPLLAGKITKPGLSLLQRSSEAAKIGALQGSIAGAGYTEGEVGERVMGGLAGGVTGAAIGGALPSLVSGAVQAPKAISNAFKKSQLNKFNKDDIRSIKIISEQFAKDEIPVEEVLQKINDNIDADKLVGLAPVEILADYGGDAVNRKLRGIKTRVPGMNIDKQLIERTSGTTEQKAAALADRERPNIQSSRILTELEDTTKQTIKTPKISLDAGIDDLSNAIDSYLSPLYETAFLKNQKITNLDLYKSLNTPVIKDAYKDAANTYREKLIAENRDPFPIPSLKDLYIKENGKIVGVSKELPLEFLNLIKRSADQQTFQKIKEGSINTERARNRKKIANAFRENLKDSVLGTEYKDALSMAADRFALQNAFEKGAMFKKPSSSAKAFDKEFNNLKTDIERDAFRVGVFQELYNDINRIGDNIDLVKKIFDSPDLRQKLFILFGNDINARKQFIERLVRESNISVKTGTIIGGSNTAEKVLDAEDAIKSLSDIIVAGTSPTSSAGIRAEASLFTKARDIISNPTEKRARSVGKVLLEKNPTRQKEILDLMLQLQKQGKYEGMLRDQIVTGVSRPISRYGVQLIPQTFVPEE